MLTLISFDGYLMADLEKTDRFSVKNVIQEAVDDHGCDLSYIFHKIIKPSDIPHDWEKSIPYGDRSDDKKCIDIFYDEILPKQPIDDPNQTKFGFFKETLTGGNADG